MTDVTNTTPPKPSIRQQAQAELESEMAKEAVIKMKRKLRELKDAETVVDNIKREIADLEEAIEQGNV